MGRYRPPQKPSSKYITMEGKTKMEQELSFLWKEKRPAVTKSVSEAAAQGDRSENAEYIYGKKQLRAIDSRVRFLSKRLDDMVVVDGIPDDQKKVFFGAWVEVEDEDIGESSLPEALPWDQVEKADFQWQTSQKTLLPILESQHIIFIIQLFYIFKRLLTFSNASTILNFQLFLTGRIIFF